MSNFLASEQCGSLGGLGTYIREGNRLAGQEHRGRNSKLRTSRLRGAEGSEVRGQDGRCDGPSKWDQASVPSEGMDDATRLVLPSPHLIAGEPACNLRSLTYCFYLGFH